MSSNPKTFAATRHKRGQAISHANTAANWYARVGTDKAHASIYDDGALIYLKVSKDQQDMIAEQMGKSIIDSARSSDDSCGVIIVPSDDMDNYIDHVAWYLPLKFTDCRQLDDHTIELFVGNRIRRYAS